MDYCTPADLFQFGLPRGAAPNPGRLVHAVDAVNDALTLDMHGMSEGDEVSFRAESGGALPAPLVAGVTYFASPVNEYTFQIKATPAATPIDITTPGARVIVITPAPIAGAITWASRIIDDSLPAHLVPLQDPIHELVRMTCAELAAGKLLAMRGAASQSIGEMVDAAQKRLQRWARGVPLRGANTPPPANLAASASAPRKDRRGWAKWGGL